MAHLPSFVSAGFGEYAKKELWYSQAIKIGNTIECSGQGGWDRQTHAISKDLAEEIAQAFDNVDAAVKCAGGEGWKNVYKIRSYHCPPLDEKVLELMVANAKKWCPGHQPLWTCIGVPQLAREDMRVEIEVKAHVE